MQEFLGVDLKKLLRVGLMVLSVLVAIFILYKLSYYFAPFIVAFIIASLMEPLIKLIIKKLKIPRKFAAPIVLLIFLSVLALIIVIAIIKLIDEIKSISHDLPGFFSQIYTSFNYLLLKGTQLYQWLPSDISTQINDMISNLSNSLVSLANSIIKGAISTAASLPEALIFLLITILATYFMSSDRDRIHNFFVKQFPHIWIERYRRIRDDMFLAMFGYLRSALIMISITFTELLIGFSIINIRYVLLLAFIVSIVDALPVLGTGTVLLPWAAYSFITGNIRLGISLIVLYVVVLAVRQIIEPRVLGHQIGVYPLLTLLAMYAGLKIFGVFGLILGPITFLLIKNILMGMFKNIPIKELIASDAARFKGSNGGGEP